ncbi:MAG TPA: hypothetical protein ENH21_05820 [Chromatiales bacterium]|nr:hypothetical protein [Chromatiales bacterium]HEX22932.1 hypothetical protein [Chromatiales bacterium]
MKSYRKLRQAVTLSAIFSLLLVTVACTDELVSETPGTKTVSSKLVPLLFLDDPQSVIVTEDKRIIVDGDHSVEPGQRTKIRLYKSGRRYLCVEGHGKCWQIAAIPEEDDPDPKAPASPSPADANDQPTPP